MKELTRTYSDLLQDKRVRSEQNKYEAFSRQRNSVMSKYRKIYSGYRDLVEGLARAQSFYSEMKETSDSLKANVETFVNNRRSEGGQLLSAIESAKASGSGAQADRERERLKELMERMSVDPSQSPGLSNQQRHSAHRPPPLQSQTSYGAQPPYNPAASPPITPRYQPGAMQNGQNPMASPQYPPFSQPTPTNASFRRESYQSQQQQQPPREPYNPNTYGPVSPPAHHQYFSPPPGQYSAQTQPNANYAPQVQSAQTAYGQVPAGYVPPPPPPGPPPSQDFAAMQATGYPAGPGGYAADPRRSAGGDPWAGLSAWK